MNDPESSYKITGIGEIPDEWEAVSLGEVISLEYGSGLPESRRVPGESPVYGSRGIVGYHKQAFVKGPGIVVGRKGTIGAVSWVESDFWPIDTTYYVSLKRADISMRWLYYELTQLRLERLNAATGVPGLNRNEAYAVRISLPPLPEQCKIVSILSGVDDKLDKEKQRRQELEQLKKGLMQALLTGKARVKVD